MQQTNTYNPLLDNNLKSEITRKEKISILMNLFLKEGFSFNNTEFKREMVAANRLISAYPDFDFFFSLPDLTNKFNSLLGLTGKELSNDLSNRYKDFAITQRRRSNF